MKYSTSSLVALALVISSSAVLAAPDSEFIRPFYYDQKSIMVEFDDLDLASPDHARTMLSRINDAAIRVCERTNQRERLYAMKDEQRCVARTYDATVADIKQRLEIDVEALAASDGHNQKSVTSAGL
jgi:UrcA family protein